MTDIRQLSTHMADRREKAGKDHILEGLLQRWGEWCREQVYGVDYGSQSPIYTAMMTRQVHAPARPGQINPQQTRVVKPKIPGYRPHEELSNLDQFIRRMSPPLKKALRHRYQFELDLKEMAEILGWKYGTCKSKLSEARRVIRENYSYPQKKP